MLLFVLGRQPEIGFAELTAVLGGHVKLIAPEIAVFDDESAWSDKGDSDKELARRQFARLGSVVKIAEVLDEIPDLSRPNLTKIASTKFNGIDGKITLGISCYDKKMTAHDALKIGLELKNILGKKNSVRLIPNSEKALNSAAVFHNKLDGDNLKKTELIFARRGDGRILAARTIFVQDINSYTFRDRGRPKRDARVGMLPPKLAQTMINLATGGKTTGQLLDPFCGTGVVLQEAALIGFDVYGTDLEPRMIDYSEQNLEWLKQTHHVNFKQKLAAVDATDQIWDKPLDFVVTETYLGRAYSAEPTEDNLHENMTNCDLILTKFLKNLVGQVTPETGICLAVPCWFVRNRLLRLNLTKNLASFGYEQIFYSGLKTPLIYHREDQIVGRELLVLRKKSV